MNFYNGVKRKEASKTFKYGGDEEQADKAELLPFCFYQLEG